MASAIQSLSTAASAATAFGAYTASQIANPLTVATQSAQSEVIEGGADSVVTLGSTTAGQDIYNAAGTLTTTAASGSTPAIGPNKLSVEISAAQEASNIAKKLADQDAALAASLAKILAGKTTVTSTTPPPPTATTPMPTAQGANEAPPASTASQTLAALAQSPGSTGTTTPLDQLLSTSGSLADTTKLATTSRIDLTSSATTSNQNVPGDPVPVTVPPPAAISSGAATAGSITLTRSIPTTTENIPVTSISPKPAGSRELAHPPVSNLLLDTARTASSSKQNNQVIAAGMASTADQAMSPVSTLASPPVLVGTSQQGIAKNHGASPQPMPAVLAEAVATASTRTPPLLAVTAKNTVLSSTAPVTPGSAREVASSPASTLTLDPSKQAIATVTQNPAYANLIAGHYTSMATSSVQSPFAAAIPIRIEETKPTIAIPAVNSLSQLGAQSGREGNPGLGYRQRRAYFAQLPDRY